MAQSEPVFLKSKGVMVDIETLSTRADACITSIGAVKFTFADGIVDKFKVNIDPVSCKHFGLHLDPKTIEWWASQDKEARDGWMHNPEPIDLLSALNMFVDWWGTKKDLYFWCNGLSFDAPIMNFSFDKTKIKKPWGYHHEMDLRTVYSLLGVDYKSLRAASTEHVCHDSLADATAQALQLISLFK